MTIKVAINGFGRIGRLVLRKMLEDQNGLFKVVAVNDLCDLKTNLHLFKYDSIHGRYQGSVDVQENSVDFGSGPVEFIQERDPSKLPWNSLEVDVVLECSGQFADQEKASLHLKAGAQKVLISAPAKDVEMTVVYGVNHHELRADHSIVSNASCTTNCLAPVAKVLNDAFGIEKGFMTTIHAYTGDQRLVDTMHKDPWRARAAGLSMIPTSTGAARAVGLVLPALKGKIDGTAIRVPTANVSMIDFTFIASKNVIAEQINDVMKKSAVGDMKNIIDYVEDPLVSIDFNHSSFSANFDSSQTQITDGNFCRVLAWYDNEWGFTNRMLDTLKHMVQL